MLTDAIAADLKALEETFSGQPRPQCTKRVARALDDEWYPSASRVQELQQLDREQSWRDLSDEELVEFCDVLFWMDPEAFRFYYPAFLAYTLRNWDGVHNRIHDEALGSIANRPENIESMSLAEARLVCGILQRLQATEKGCDASASESIEILVQRINILPVHGVRSWI